MPDAFFVSNLFFGYNRKPFAGGMEIHLKSIIDLLNEHGFYSTVLQRWYKNELIHQDECLTVQGVNVPFYLYNLAWNRKIYGTPKIIHLNDVAFSFPSVNEKTSVTFHGVSWGIPARKIPTEWVQQKFLIPKVHLIRRHYIMNTRYAIKRCRKVLSVDNSLLHIVQHELPDYRDKIEVIRNFVDTHKFYPKGSTKHKFGLNAEDIVILYPRNISLAKGHFLLFEIIKRIAKEKSNIKFLIAGGDLKELGKEKYLEILYDKIIREKLVDYVQFIGSIPHDQMVDVFNASDIVIIPTFFGEGCSLATLEAMACKKIVVVSNIGGLNDTIINGYNGFLVKPDSVSFVKKILYLLENRELLKSIAENAFDIAKEVYDKKEWEKQVLDFFKL